jgi:hypothetical protein
MHQINHYYDKLNIIEAPLNHLNDPAAYIFDVRLRFFVIYFLMNSCINILKRYVNSQMKLNAIKFAGKLLKIL